MKIDILREMSFKQNSSAVINSGFYKFFKVGLDEVMFDIMKFVQLIQ